MRFVIVIVVLCLAVLNASPIKKSKSTTNLWSSSSEDLDGRRDKAISVAALQLDSSNLSVKDVISLSLVNRGIREYLKHDFAWPTINALTRESCYSTIAQDSFYVPILSTTTDEPSNTTQSRRQAIRIVFSQRYLNDLDGFETEATKKVVACLDGLLLDGVTFIIEPKEPLGQINWPYFLQGETKRQHDYVSLVKTTLLLHAIRHNVTRVAEFLLQPTQRTPIYKAHFVVATKMKDEQTIAKLISTHRDTDSLQIMFSSSAWCTGYISRSTNFLSYTMKHYEPSENLLHLILQNIRLRSENIWDAAFYDRKSTLRFLILNGPNAGLSAENVRRTLVLATQISVRLCRTEILDMLIHEQGVELDEDQQEEAVLCAIKKRDFEKARQYIELFGLESTQFFGADGAYYIKRLRDTHARMFDTL